MSDVDKALERVRPGDVNVQLGNPGYSDVVAFTSSAGAAVQFRNVGNVAQYVSIKAVGNSVHVSFGPSTVAAPTNTEWLLEPGDSVQDFQLQPDDTHIRLKGDSGSGSLYLLISGR